jgi:hypothetical protein
MGLFLTFFSIDVVLTGPYACLLFKYVWHMLIADGFVCYTSSVLVTFVLD